MPAGKEVADSDLRPAITLGAARGTCCVTNQQLTTYGKTPEAQIVQKPAGQVDGRHPHSEHFDGSPPGRGGTLEQRAETVQALPRLARHAHCTLVQSLPQGQGLVQRLAEAAITALPSRQPKGAARGSSRPRNRPGHWRCPRGGDTRSWAGEIRDLAGCRRTQRHPPVVRGNPSPATAGPAPTAAGSSPRHNPTRNSGPTGSAAAPVPHDAAASDGRTTAAASAAGRPPPPSRNTQAGAPGSVPIFGQRREAAARKWDCPPWLAQKPGQPREMSPTVPRPCGVRLARPQQRQQFFQLVGLPDVVLIGQEEVVGAAVAGVLHYAPKVPRRPLVSAAVVEHLDAGVSPGQFPQNLGGRVGRAVVPCQQRPVGIGLATDALDQGSQILGPDRWPGR